MKIRHLKILVTILVLASGTNAWSQYQYPFQNPELTIESRIDNILSLMTLDEKVACFGTNPSVPRLGIKGTGHVEGLHGLALGGPGRWGRDNPVTTTTFPQAIGLAESWDPQVIRQVAETEAYEVRWAFQNDKYHRGGMVVRAPNADIGRDPRWGRTEECYGEDAWYNGTMVVSYIKGLQGDDPKYWKAASLMKHFLANSNENGRDSSSSDFDERLLREYYSLPFYMGVTKGGSRAFMAAYNAYNGIPMTVHPMLKEMAVNEWGQNGIICTDGGAFRLLLNAHKYYPDPYKGAAAVVKAGINQFLDNYREGIYGALANGYLKEEDLDAVLRGDFRVMIKLGLLDPPEQVPYSKIGVTDTQEPWLTDKNKETVREVTRKTIVLLKNEKNTLPLDENKIKSIAVIGSVANDVFLDWYSGTPPYSVSALDGIKNRLKNNVVIKYAKDNDADAAVNIAKSSDVAILVVGNHPYCNAKSWKECSTPSFGREAVDRRTIYLEEEELIKQVYAVNPNTIVVLVSSFPYAINWSQGNIPAIVHMTHNSQEMGNALADVLFGDFNPGGRLVQTWPASMEQLPDMMDYNIRHGRTYMYFKGKPLYPFGYGLSYTTFRYSGMKVSSSQLKGDGEVAVSVDVQNTGKREGDEVVQLYVKYLDSKVERPLKEIRGFQRITLKPGEKKTVKIPLKAETLAYWDADQKKFVVEKGKIQVQVGTSSANVKGEKTIQVIP